MAVTSPDCAAQTGVYPLSVSERFTQSNAAPARNLAGWRVQSSASLRGGYDDNITSSAIDPASSPERELRGALEAVREIESHTFTGSAAIAQTSYSSAPRNDDTEGRLGATAALRLHPRLVLRGAVGVEEGRETSALANGINVNGAFDPYLERASFRRLPMEGGLDYDFGRWSLSADADLAYVDYDPQTTRAGLTIDQSFRNGRESELRTRAAYEIHPNLSLFGEVAGNRRRFDDPSGDNDGWRLTGGGEFEFLRLLVGDAYAGYASQRYLTGGAVSGLTVGASLNWYADERVSFRFDARREFRADQVTNSSTVTSAAPLIHEAVGLRAEYEPLRRLLVFGQVNYERDRRESVNRVDTLTTLIIGGSVVMTRKLRLVLDLQHENGASDFAGDHSRDRVSVGVAAFY
jgi:hypothetical protein